MIDKYRDKLEEKGVSPVIRVILLVAVTVALVALATVIVFDIGSDVSDTADASVQMEQTDSGVQATIVRNENVDEFILRHEDGTEQRSTKSIGSFTYDNGDGEYTLIGVVGGNEEVIRSTTVVGAESGETLSGTVEINPLIVGATVEAYDAGGTLVDSTTTDANGQYELTVADASSARIVLNTEGDITYNGEPLHASAEQSGFSAGDTVNFNFDENTATSGISVNGESVTVVSALEGESSSVIEVGNLAQLQAMQGDLSADYKLIRNIDASETETWNEKTSDEFNTYLSNGDTTELNLVASEGTINVVDSTGTDVAFTSNTNNDSITIDDTAIDTPQDLTISYDLETPINQGFDPVGTYDFEKANSEFTGSFDGQNHTISNLSINRLDDNDVGLFGAIGAVGEVKNVGVINVNITGESYVGGLVGSNSNGTVSNSYSTGNVTGESYYVGGLIGYNRDGTVSNSYSTGNVSGESYVGGLVGRNINSNISNSYSTGNVTGESDYVGGLVGRNSNGNISNSYSTGNVSGESDYVGGLVGRNNNGTVSNSYSTGNVTGEFVGGLIGYNREGTVSNSYSTGNVSGESYVGGLVGRNYNGNISNSYWNSDSTITEDSTDVSTDNTKSGVPLTTSQMQGSSASSSMSGFDFTDTWSTVTGDYPELQG
jgi:flagellin-like protein